METRLFSCFSFYSLQGLEGHQADYCFIAPRPGLQLEAPHLIKYLDQLVQTKAQMLIGVVVAKVLETFLVPVPHLAEVGT